VPEPTPASVNAVLTGQGIDPAVAMGRGAKGRKRLARGAGRGRQGRGARGRRNARAEITSEGQLRWWRPLYALELSMFDCPAFAVTLLHAL
jgi:hypothetical protein